MTASAVSASADHAAVAYDATAPFYDVLSQGDDYGVFGDILERLIRQAGPPGNRLLDAGCGTGRSTAAFAARGFAPTGFDISSGMIAVARARHAGTGIGFHVHDIREPFTAGGPYDVVLCMSDILNYVVDEAGLAQALGSLGQALAPGGVLVFDANTRCGYEVMTRTHVYEYDGLYVTMAGRFLSGEGEDPRRFRMVMNAFRRSSEDPRSWTRERIVHLQRHHSAKELAAGLDAAGLDLLGAHGLRRDGTLSEETDERTHTKALFVARRRRRG